MFNFVDVAVGFARRLWSGGDGRIAATEGAPPASEDALRAAGVPLEDGAAPVGPEAETQPLLLVPRRLSKRELAEKPADLNGLVAKAECRAATVDAAVLQAETDRIKLKWSGSWVPMIKDALGDMRLAMECGAWESARNEAGFVMTRADSFDQWLKEDREPVEKLGAQVAKYSAALIDLIPERNGAAETIAALRATWGDEKISSIAGNDLAADRRIGQAIKLLIQASNELGSRDLEDADRDLDLLRVWVAQARLYLRAIKEMKIRLEASRGLASVEEALENRVETVIDADHWFVRVHMGDVRWGDKAAEAVRLHEAAKALPTGSRLDLLDQALALASQELATGLAIVERRTVERIAALGQEPTDAQKIDAHFPPASQPINLMCEYCH